MKTLEKVLALECGLRWRAEKYGWRRSWSELKFSDQRTRKEEVKILLMLLPGTESKLSPLGHSNPDPGHSHRTSFSSHSATPSARRDTESPFTLLLLTDAQLKTCPTLWEASRDICVFLKVLGSTTFAPNWIETFPNLAGAGLLSSSMVLFKWSKQTSGF